MRRYLISGLAWHVLAAVAVGQSAEPRTPSVIRPAGYGWRNHVVVPDGPCGCAMPVRTDCYDNCCFRCGLRPICFLHRVGRMLDCLLPCNTCCGVLGGPLLGGPGCCGGGGTIGCSTPVGHPTYRPAYGDPFHDDPLPTPPIPTPTPASEVRRGPSRPSHHAAPIHTGTATGNAPSASPWKITHGPAEGKPAPGHDLRASIQRPVNATAGHSPILHPPAGQSVLRRVSAEEAIAPVPHDFDPTGALPIVRSQSPAVERPRDGAIPHNPLRSK
jgi:hypothetical protein